MSDYFAKATGTTHYSTSTRPEKTTASSLVVTRNAATGQITTTSRTQVTGRDKSWTAAPSSSTPVDAVKKSMDSAINGYSKKTTVVVRRYGIK